jgi:hypothetical protein
MFAGWSNGCRLAEGAAVATALGGGGRRRRRRVLSGSIEMLVTGEEGLPLERCRLGKVGWQVGTRVARPACCCSGSSAAAGIVARAECLAGLATCMHTAFRRLVTAQP